MAKIAYRPVKMERVQEVNEFKKKAEELRDHISSLVPNRIPSESYLNEFDNAIMSISKLLLDT
jgi:hypothetical protein